MNTKPEIHDLIESFKRTTDEFLTPQELENRLQSGKKLTLKYGADVTSPDLHIGHAVNLWMYRELQELGHKFVFLIGDFTTRIGDPTGRDVTRPIIHEEQIQANAAKFIEQVKMVVLDDPEVFEVRRNSEWFGKMSAEGLLKLMSQVTQDRLLSREMFRRRIESNLPIYQHELVYPLIQGYDSVALKSDITIVGSDQLFNEKMGRFYQEKESQTPQVIITTKITPGIDGKEKQSKSIGNYIGLSHSPRDKFGRVMKIPDSLIQMYFEVYTQLPLTEIQSLKSIITTDPMSAKMKLAESIVARYHGISSAKAEREWFVNTFSKGETPEDLKEIVVTEKSLSLLTTLRKCYPLELKSNSELKRLIQQGGVKVNGEAVSDMNSEISVTEQGVTLKVGKRGWFRVVRG